MKIQTELWLKALWAAFITGLSNSVLAALGISGANAVGLNIAQLNAKQVIVMGLVGGIVGLLAYLKQSPVPPDSDNAGGKLPLIALICGLSLSLTGCITPQNPTGTVAVGGVNIDPQATGNAVQIAAKLGALATINANPDSRQYFQISAGVIDAAIAAGNYSPTNIQESLTLATGNTIAAESISDALQLYSDFFGKVTATNLASQSPYTVPVLNGLAAGLQQAVDLTK